MLAAKWRRGFLWYIEAMSFLILNDETLKVFHSIPSLVGILPYMIGIEVREPRHFVKTNITTELPTSKYYVVNSAICYLNIFSIIK